MDGSCWKPLEQLSCSPTIYMALLELSVLLDAVACYQLDSSFQFVLFPLLSSPLVSFVNVHKRKPGPSCISSDIESILGALRAIIAFDFVLKSSFP